MLVVLVIKHGVKSIGKNQESQTALPNVGLAVGLFDSLWSDLQLLGFCWSSYWAERGTGGWVV